jgi:hypothetical protein
MTVNNEMQWTLKEAVVAQFKLLSRNSPAVIEVNREKKKSPLG